MHDEFINKSEPSKEMPWFVMVVPSVWGLTLQRLFRDAVCTDSESSCKHKFGTKKPNCMLINN